MQSISVKRKRIVFSSDASRVITKPFIPRREEHLRNIIHRVLNLTSRDRRKILAKVMGDFSSRHHDLEKALSFSFDLVRHHVPDSRALSKEVKLLIGACFTHEYAAESTALFNPSIVPHPDQDNLEYGSLRFILSFRGVGEGHISSIVFRSGVLDERGNLIMDPVSPHVEMPKVELDPYYDKHTFLLKLEELAARDAVSERILSPLPDRFRFEALQEQIRIERKKMRETLARRKTIEVIEWVAQSNYEERFRPDSHLTERVIFPVAKDESNGIEDARFVCMDEEDGGRKYYATYTAYDGRDVLPMMLETIDFCEFKIRTLNGREARDKGMALFPRKVNGKYAMIGRQDGENLYYMQSDNLHFWHHATLISSPSMTWEIMQIGNCGSPIETEAGWILLTHGVGPMRRYCISAVLLDLYDPSKMIGRLREPLIVPEEHEREGYVPNVVYTCGAMIHGETLIIPYAFSDTSSGIATVDVGELLEALQSM